MLNVVQGQQVESLAAHLAQRLHADCAVFERVAVIVPSMALSDWLDKRLAAINGISALTDYHFFGMFQWGLVERVTEQAGYQASAPLSTEAIHWRLFAWLYANGERILQCPEHELHSLLSVLFEGQTQVRAASLSRLWALSEQLARIFGRYMSLRPWWLEAWQQGEALPIEEMLAQQGALPDWLCRHYHQLHAMQRYLWRELFAKRYDYRARRVANFWRLLAEKPALRGLLPERVVFFTLSGLTPEAFTFVRLLAPYCEITLYHHAPTEHFIEVIVDAKWLQRRKIDCPGVEKAHFDAGNTLLSRFGKQARDLARLLRSTQEGVQATDSGLAQTLTAKALPNTLLGYLQHDIHTLDEDVPSRDYFRCLIEEKGDDDSFRVHACHGLLRQLEVLRAELVAWLNADATRQLSDILIVLPDIEAHQALIQSVFPTDGRYDGMRLPARLTGVVGADTQRLWSALAGFCRLAEGDFNARAVIDWLLLSDTCAALGVTTETMTRATDLLYAAGFRRGFDEAQLAEGLAAGDDDYRFCFTYALDRLLAGLLMPTALMYADSVVMPNVQMSDSEGVTALAQAAQIIAQVRRLQAEGHHVFAWLDWIETLLQTHFSHAEQTQAYSVIRHTLADLRYQISGQQTLSAIDGDQDLPLAFVLDYVEGGLATRQTSSEPSGAITIGRLGAMRGLPYKLIAFVNANIEVFPQASSDNRYDLIEIDRRRAGDQIKAEDDLGAFLDVILSAREACWFFYDRYRPEDSHEHLPSPPLQELLDYLSANCPNSEQAQQAFIRSYAQNPFDDAGAQTVAVPLWQSIQQQLKQSPQTIEPVLRDLPTPSFAQVFTPPATTIGTTLLTRVTQDLKTPASTYARGQQLAFLRQDSEFSALEPISDDGLTRHSVDQYFIQHLVQPQAIAGDTLLQRLPLVPAGAYGKHWLAGRKALFTERLQTLLATAQCSELTPTTLQTINLGQFSLSVDLPTDRQTSRWVKLSPGRARHKYLLAAWLEHLLWQVNLDGASNGGQSHCAFQDSIVVFEALTSTQAAAYALDWLHLWHYMQQQFCLLPLELLFAFHEEMRKPKATDSLKTFNRLYNNWLREDGMGRIYKEDQAEVWTHLWRGHDATTIERVMAEHVITYHQRLLTPLFDCLKTEDTHETDS